MRYDSMEQANSKIDLQCYTNGGIDISNVLNVSSNVKRKVARRRWAILAKALKSPSGSEPSSPTDECSVRRISSFMLLTTQQLENVVVNTQEKLVISEAKKRSWYKYSMRINHTEYDVIVGHRMRTFSAEDLMGFNNTGNVCIWPSEETLTYYIGANLELFRGKTVLELGGGMSCLAGLICGKYGAAKNVLLTDGNKISIENVKISLACNEFTCPVDCTILKWGKDLVERRFDVILCADCLFFDEARADLIDTVWNLLELNGLALIMAPKRGTTLENFIGQCMNKGFQCNKIINYNEHVWEKHLLLLSNCDYDDNIHYPILIELTKMADYWKSNARKYCEFCKCWITDNKPSVEFHEKGRRHQNNVAKRLKHITIKSRRDQIENVKIDAALAKMESAAMEAYRKDVENNADLTSQAINQRVQENNLQISGAGSSSSSSSSSGSNVWKQVKADDGSIYYWNTVTQVTSWETPKDYVPPKLVGPHPAPSKSADTKEWKEYQKQLILNTRLRIEEEKRDKEEDRAKLEREKLKERRVEEIEVVEPAPIIEERKTNPYGRWTTVKITKEEDIPLPSPTEEKQSNEEYTSNEAYQEEEEEEPAYEFKEKTIESLGGSQSIEFKKRKIKGGNKRNTRQRLDDD